MLHKASIVRKNLEGFRCFFNIKQGIEMKGKTKFGVLIGSIVIVAVLSITYAAAKYYKARNENALQTTLQVSRLSCSSCLATIEDELQKFDGMLGMRADLAQGLVTVSHTEAFPPEKIAETISGAGYPAKVIEVAQVNGSTPPVTAPTGYGCGGSSGCGSSGCGLPYTAPEKS